MRINRRLNRPMLHNRDNSATFFRHFRVIFLTFLPETSEHRANSARVILCKHIRCFGAQEIVLSPLLSLLPLWRAAKARRH